MDTTLRIEELLDESGWLRHLAASLVEDRGQAEDLVQDTWVAALRRPPRAGEPRPWLGRVLRNLSRNAGRSRSRRAAREDFAHEERAEAGPDALAQEAEAQHLLAEAVTRLAEPLRAAIVLRYFQGLDSSAVAARLAVPPSTVRTRLQRALEALRADLDRRHGGRRSWAALLTPLARGAGTAAGTPVIGTTASLVAGAGTVCILAMLGATNWSTADDERRAASPALAAISPDASVPVADEGVAPQRGGREPLGGGEGAVATTETAAPHAPAAAAQGAGGTGELSGTLLVDGRPPEWPIELYLEPRIPRTQGKEPGKRVKVPEPITVLPEQRGKFAFEDIPVDWRLGLRVDANFDLVAGNESVTGRDTLELDGPTTGLVLQLTARPEIVGRILGPDGKPAAHVSGKCEIRVGETGQPSAETRDWHFSTREDGRFRVKGVAAGEWAALTLLVQEESHGYLLHETPAFARADRIDVGDLRLEPLRRLSFTVRARDGKPIALVFAEPVAEQVAPSWHETDRRFFPDGSGVLPALPDRPVDVRFGARGYEDRVVRVGAVESIEVVLEPATMLEVRLLDPASSSVLLTAERSAFAWDQAAWDEALEHHDRGPKGATLRRRPSMTSPADGRFVYQLFPDDATFTIPGVTPGLRVTLEVRDALEQTLASRTLTLLPQEHAVLELGVPDRSGALPSFGGKAQRTPGLRARTAESPQRPVE